jgi:metal-responsive CopG/Arc/MetJ family transcriptional regulator
MAQTTIRLPDDLLDRIDEATGPETSRSEWLREAARDRLTDEQVRQTEQRLDDLDRRLSRLERLHDRPLLQRLLR